MSSSAFPTRTVAGAAAAIVAVAGAVAVIPRAANASGYEKVRLAPRSDVLLFVDVSGASTNSLAQIIEWPLTGENQAWVAKARSLTENPL